jgi:hypothetical protein
MSASDRPRSELVRRARALLAEARATTQPSLAKRFRERAEALALRAAVRADERAAAARKAAPSD